MSSQVCGYADDLNIIGESSVDVKESFISLAKSANQVELEVIDEKPK